MRYEALTPPTLQPFQIEHIGCKATHCNHQQTQCCASCSHFNPKPCTNGLQGILKSLLALEEGEDRHDISVLSVADADKDTLACFLDFCYAQKVRFCYIKCNSSLVQDNK